MYSTSAALYDDDSVITQVYNINNGGYISMKDQHLLKIL